MKFRLHEGQESRYVRADIMVSTTPQYSFVDEEDLEFADGNERGSADLPVASKGKYERLADRVLFSTIYFVIYIFVILCNVILIVWLLVMMGKQQFETRGHWAFLALDFFVNFAFVTEIALQIVSQKKAYFSKCSNLFDFGIMLLSVLSLCIYFTREGVGEQLEDLLALGLMGIRYGLQFLRLAVIVRKQRALHRSRKGVDFSQLTPEDFHFIEAGAQRV